MFCINLEKLFMMLYCIFVVFHRFLLDVDLYQIEQNKIGDAICCRFIVSTE